MIKTELWPHIVANEDDGGDTTSENITLAKFLSCYTCIMATCVGKEARGRPVLLHAITSPLEYLPWAEVRTFHNVVMVKLEQDRISWTSDFVALADQFIDKKVRLSLRTKSQPTNSSGYRGGFRNSSRGFSGQNARSREGQNRFVFYNLCKQWNEGTCTYGARCKKWHVCRACGEAGKMGEPHKSPSPDCPSSKKGRIEQRSQQP